MIAGIPILAIYGIYLITIYHISYYKRKESTKKYNEFLATIEGTNFFCYNNRKKGFDYIQEEILPQLSPDIKILFVNSRRIEIDEYDFKHLSTALYSFKNYNNFPHLLKIRNGKTVDKSISSEFFNCLNNGARKEVLIEKINAFFNISES
jgi:hypothetical protein